MITIVKSAYGTFEDGTNYAAAGLRMTYEVVSSVWGVGVHMDRKGSEPT